LSAAILALWPILAARFAQPSNFKIDFLPTNFEILGEWSRSAKIASKEDTLQYKRSQCNDL